MHFSIPSVPLLANTLIITGFGNVHSQELLVMDSTQLSIPYLVMAEKWNILVLYRDLNGKYNRRLNQSIKSNTVKIFKSVKITNAIT